jgi:Ca2+-binding RTX toxin-like protein
MGGAMKSMKLGMIWVLVGMGLAMLLSVGVLGSAQSVSALDSTDPVLVGAGDIASCASTGDEATARLLAGINGTVVASLGDNAYDSGTSQEFAHCYDNYKLPSEGGGVFDPTRSYYWGQYKALIKPAVGNHEYETPGSTASSGASGYFGYFGNAASPTETACTVDCKGYYSYDLGSWHVVVLNSNCDKVGGCGPGSPQEVWLQNDLQNDLQAHPSGQACTLAYWHHPRFSSGPHGNNTLVDPFWNDLYQAGAEVVLNGHDHDYERFAPQTSSGVEDPAQGISEFVVGTGGKSHYAFRTIQPNSKVRNSDTYGVLKLTFHASSYDWQFVPQAGKTFSDSGSGQCHGAPGETDTVAPTVSSVAPIEGATDVASTANTEATFSEAMDPNTVSTTTFTLTKQGSSTPVEAQVSYDSATKKATLDPTSDLEANTTYTATIKGGSTGAEDLAGNALAQDYTWTFTTAAPPPPSCTITGTAYGDTISGTSGADVICAGGGNDTVKGLGGNDILKGEDGNDKLLGGVGDDNLDGGLGTDTASYSASLTAVNASLATNSSTGEGTDTFLDVENLLGSSKADTLTGSGANNTLTGGGGADTERGGAGNDKVVGSGGADFLYGEDGDDTVKSKDGVNGNDSLDGGAGTDTKVTDTTEKSIVGFP